MTALWSSIQTFTTTWNASVMGIVVKVLHFVLMHDAYCS